MGGWLKRLVPRRVRSGLVAAPIPFPFSFRAIALPARATLGGMGGQAIVPKRA